MRCAPFDFQVGHLEVGVRYFFFNSLDASPRSGFNLVCIRIEQHYISAMTMVLAYMMHDIPSRKELLLRRLLISFTEKKAK